MMFKKVPAFWVLFVFFFSVPVTSGWTMATQPDKPAEDRPAEVSAEQPAAQTSPNPASQLTSLSSMDAMMNDGGVSNPQPLPSSSMNYQPPMQNPMAAASPAADSFFQPLNPLPVSSASPEPVNTTAAVTPQMPMPSPSPNVDSGTPGDMMLTMLAPSPSPSMDPMMMPVDTAVTVPMPFASPSVDYETTVDDTFLTEPVSAPPALVPEKVLVFGPTKALVSGENGETFGFMTTWGDKFVSSGETGDKWSDGRSKYTVVYSEAKELFRLRLGIDGSVDILDVKTGKEIQLNENGEITVPEELAEIVNYRKKRGDNPGTIEMKYGGKILYTVILGKPASVLPAAPASGFFIQSYEGPELTQLEEANPEQAKNTRKVSVITRDGIPMAVVTVHEDGSTTIFVHDGEYEIKIDAQGRKTVPEGFTKGEFVYEQGRRGPAAFILDGSVNIELRDSYDIMLVGEQRQLDVSLTPFE